MKSFVVGTDATMAAVMSGENVFVTGAGGSGKSHMIATLRDFFSGSVLLLAPTGIAALNIQGMTAHKACGLTFGITTKEDYKAKGRAQAILMSSKAIELLIIDEISMIRRDKLAEIDMKLRYHRKINEPFGGLQVVVFGDGFQISPVLTRKEAPDFHRAWGDELPFNSEVWNSLDFRPALLEKIHRQADPVFAAHLNNMRIGADLPNVVKYLNENCYGKGTMPDAVTLCTTNKMADDINQREYDKLPGKGHTFKASVVGDFPDRPVHEVLHLKEGLKVMICTNHNPQEGEEPLYVNGTVGIVSRVAKTYVLVNVDGEDIPIYQNSWENIGQEPQTERRKVKKTIKNEETGEDEEIEVEEDVEVLVDVKLGKYTQFPLKLGYAITGHKSQGLTLSKVNVDLGNGAFTAGQTYVMISRARDVQGLRLVKPLRVKDIIVDRRVLSFYRQCFPGKF